MQRKKSIPKLRPLPLNLRKRQKVTPTNYVRSYGTYTTKQGKIKRFSYQIKVKVEKNRTVLFKSIKRMCAKLLHNEVPLHKQGEVFEDFGVLLIRTPWIKVRKVRNYKAGVIYAR